MNRDSKMIYRRFPLYLAFVFLGVAFSRSAVAQIEFDFPESTVPVLRVDEYYNEANKDRRPMLLVYSDGRVVRAVSGVEADDYEFTLSESKFKKVLKQIFTDNDFATISDEKILDEISSPRRRKRPSRTSFRVTANTSEKSNVVDFGTSWVHDRLGLGRKRHPKAEQLQRFLRVEDTCRELSNLALCGGEEAFQDLVNSANAKFKEAYPKGPEIGDSDLFSVRHKDGEVVVRFRVARKVVDPHPVSIWITKTKAEVTKGEDAKGEDAKEQKLNIEVKVDKPILLQDVPTRPTPPPEA